MYPSSAWLCLCVYKCTSTEYINDTSSIYCAVHGVQTIFFLWSFFTSGQVVKILHSFFFVGFCWTLLIIPATCTDAWIPYRIRWNSGVCDMIELWHWQERNKNWKRKMLWISPKAPNHINPSKKNLTRERATTTTTTTIAQHQQQEQQQK